MIDRDGEGVRGGLDARVVVHRDNFTLDVALTIPPGETAALLGPNGAGKSTTLAALAGLTPLDDGRLVLGERVLDDPTTDTWIPPQRRRVGVVFQQYLLFEHLSVTDNVAFGLRSAGCPRREARRDARRWIEALDLTALADRRPAQLSGGQAQRVALARALAVEPELLLLDEPLAALDVETRSSMRRVLGDHLGDCGGPRLLITHDPTDAFLLAERIHVIEDGRLTQSGTADEIRRRPATPYAAALAGTNLLLGHNHDGTLVVDGVEQRLQTADTHTVGRVTVTIHPSAVALHREEPHGSPRNAWATTVAVVEPLGEITRITLGAPLPIGVDVTPAATEALELRPGAPVWASVKATEVAVAPAS